MSLKWKTRLKYVAIATLPLLLLGSSAQATVLGTYDFEGETADQVLSSIDNSYLVDVGDGRDRLVASGGAHADPWGSGNTSAVLTNRPSPASQPQMNFYKPFEGIGHLSNGTIEFDMVMQKPSDADGAEPQDEFWSYMNFRAGHQAAGSGFNNGVAGNTQISVSFRNQLGLPDSIYPGIYNDLNGYPAGTPQVIADTPTHVTFKIIPPNPADVFPNGSFEIYLDDTLVTWSDGTSSQPLAPATMLPPAAAPGINGFSFVGASESIGALGAAEVFIDNIVVTQIPEPSAVCLVLIGALVALVSGRPRK